MNGHAHRAVVAAQKPPSLLGSAAIDTLGQRRTMRQVVIIECVGAHADPSVAPDGDLFPA